MVKTYINEVGKPMLKQEKFFEIPKQSGPKRSYKRNNVFSIYSKSTRKVLIPKLIERETVQWLLNDCKNSQIDRYIKEGALTVYTNGVTKKQFFDVDEIHKLLCERIALRIDTRKRSGGNRLLRLLLSDQGRGSVHYQNGVMSVFFKKYKMLRTELRGRERNEFDRGRQDAIQSLDLKTEDGRIKDDKFIKRPLELASVTSPIQGRS